MNFSITLVVRKTHTQAHTHTHTHTHTEVHSQNCDTVICTKKYIFDLCPILGSQFLKILEFPEREIGTSFVSIFELLSSVPEVASK